MPKFRVTQRYAIWITETHEVDIDLEDYDSVEDMEADIKEINEDPVEFTHTGTLKEKVEGDCVNDSWETTVEEINVLDQIVDALVEAEKEPAID